MGVPGQMFIYRVMPRIFVLFTGLIFFPYLSFACRYIGAGSFAANKCLVVILIMTVLSMFSFSDDSTIIVEGHRHNSKMVAEKLDMILTNLETFLTRNNIKLNVDKTVIMRITTRQQLAADGPEPLYLQTKDKYGNNIKPVDSTKILGLRVNKHLTWTPT